MKGKKFSAAEKHFLGKEVQYQKKIRFLCEENQKLRRQLDECEETVRLLTDRLKRYEELVGLDYKEVMKLSEQNEKISGLIDCLLTLAKAY